jgi:hypothetical protein
MASKKIAVLVVMGILVAALSAAPAQAGLGGCGKTIKAPSASMAPHANQLVDALRWILPGNSIDILRALFHADVAGKSNRTGSTTEGLGGCIFGCKI